MQELRTAYLNLIEIECQLKSSSSNPELLFENFALQHSKKRTRNNGFFLIGFVF
ncbi:hypothetical protein [Fructilactobacillus florum]|uniref:hypothetical protein n=1 Tax=Fructilactobacillus florum TaxID=640331 RepID=UPI000B256F75